MTTQAQMGYGNKLQYTVDAGLHWLDIAEVIDINGVKLSCGTTEVTTQDSLGKEYLPGTVDSTLSITCNFVYNTPQQALIGYIETSQTTPQQYRILWKDLRTWGFMAYATGFDVDVKDSIKGTFNFQITASVTYSENSH